MEWPWPFFAAAATAMRRILVENARRKQGVKRGDGFRRVELAETSAPDADQTLLALDEGLERLGREDEVAAKVVELRRFAGMNHEQIAAALQITVFEARQKWTYARGWLRTFLKKHA